MVDMGTIKDNGSGFEQERHVDREMFFREEASFRLLLKHSLLEFYLNDILIQCFSLPGKATGRIGLIQGSGQGAIKNIRAWRGTGLSVGG